jgi:uncharacterized membrane protein YidH (DUF202 family)
MQNNNSSNRIWFYVSLLPLSLLILELIAMLIIYQQFIEELKLVSMFGIFFAEITMVISALGILAYLKSTEKNNNNKNIAKLNLLILISAFFTGLFLFLI